ncbi:MAG: patatin-like phospholipase family protein [Bacilli bacterium]|nr:patatin-like phospholipase family protein [Bacilli bacterium]
MKALVLSGGGAKGAYQLGAWKALKKLKIDFDIVTGTSIGAVNGLFIVENKYHTLKKLWLKKDMYKYFGEDLQKLNDKKKAFKIYKNNLLTGTGIDTDKFEQIIKKNIDIDKIYESNIKYGLVTYNLSSKKPEIITKEIKHKKDIVDYAIASASAFPILEPKEIKNKKYIDGGYYDNLPINLAIDLGADEVIAVDLEAIGIKRNTKDKKTHVTLIKPQIDLGDIAVFDKTINRRNYKLGYNDTMKVFKKLDGDYYTFKKNDLKKNYERYKDNFSYVLKRRLGINNKRVISELNNIPIYKRLFDNSFDDFLTMNNSLEYLGQVFELPIEIIYDIKLFNHVIRIKYANNNDKDLIKLNSIKKLDLKNVVNKKQVVKTIYTYLLSPVEFHKELYELSILFPKEYMAAIYLYTII